MSSGNSFQFGSINQTASGSGAVNQVGNNTATTTVNNGNQTPTIPQVFDAIKKALPEMDATSTDSDQSQLTSDNADDVNETILRPLQTLAELPEAELKKPDTMEQAQSLLNRLVPYAPQIGKGLAVFGGAALTSLASSNPIISGILAVCKMASAET